MAITSALAGKHVVVIGGTSGIGLAVARHAQAAGAVVTVASRDPQRAAADLSSGFWIRTPNSPTSAICGSTITCTPRALSRRPDAC